MFNFVFEQCFFVSCKGKFKWKWWTTELPTHTDMFARIRVHFWCARSQTMNIIVGNMLLSFRLNLHKIISDKRLIVVCEPLCRWKRLDTAPMTSWSESKRQRSADTAWISVTLSHLFSVRLNDFYVFYIEVIFNACSLVRAHTESGRRRNARRPDTQ